MKFITSRLSSNIVTLRRLYDMLTALVTYLRKNILVVSLQVPLKVGRIFSAYFVATFVTVFLHNTLFYYLLGYI